MYIYIYTCIYVYIHLYVYTLTRASEPPSELLHVHLIDLLYAYSCTCAPNPCRSTSLIRNRPCLRSSSRSMPKALRWP